MITLKAPVIHPQTGKILPAGSTVMLPDDFESKIVAAGNAVRCAPAIDGGWSDPETADPGAADPVDDQPNPATSFLGRIGLSNK